MLTHSVTSSDVFRMALLLSFLVKKTMGPNTHRCLLQSERVLEECCPWRGRAQGASRGHGRASG